MALREEVVSGDREVQQRQREDRGVSATDGTEKMGCAPAIPNIQISLQTSRPMVTRHDRGDQEGHRTPAGCPSTPMFTRAIEALNFVASRHQSRQSRTRPGEAWTIRKA